MTIEEALKIIKQSEECYIVWRTDTGEIVKVENLGENVSPEDRFEYLIDLTADTNTRETDKSIQYASQFRSSEMIDRTYLEEQRDDFLEMNLRVRVLNQWTEQSIIETISIIETNNFPYPTTESDTYILLERLFDFKWKEIGEPELDRLWQLTKAENLTEKDKTLLKFHLLFFERKPNEFAEFYKQMFKNPFYYISNYVDYYIGDLQIADEYVMKNYHELLNNPTVLFSAGKYPAMIALGKIGNASGEESAQIIEKVIFDSEEYIIKAKNKVLKKFELLLKTGRNVQNVDSAE